jgi:hypothetical protein
VRKSIVAAAVLTFLAGTLQPIPEVAGRVRHPILVSVGRIAPIGPGDRLPVKGLVSREVPRKRVVVKYYKRRSNKTWRLLAIKRPMLTRSRKYETEFARHTGRGLCKLSARYPGSKKFLPGTDSARLGCRSGRFRG